jgi:multisubunit Na+/H+ antiporter MnhC subunit
MYVFSFFINLLIELNLLLLKYVTKFIIIKKNQIKKKINLEIVQGIIPILCEVGRVSQECQGLLGN